MWGHIAETGVAIDADAPNGDPNLGWLQAHEGARRRTCAAAETQLWRGFRGTSTAGGERG
jgi:hypothetical protein